MNTLNNSEWKTLEVKSADPAELKAARAGLDKFSTTLDELNQQIQRLEQITEKWKEKGNLDVRV